jgi:hypothetical protein
VANARAASASINKQHAGGAQMTSAFGRSVIRHPGGRVDVSDVDSLRAGGDPERALRDTRPEDVRDIQDMERQELEELRREKAEKERAAAEAAERSGKTRGGRSRSKSFPSTAS